MAEDLLCAALTRRPGWPWRLVAFALRAAAVLRDLSQVGRLSLADGAAPGDAGGQGCRRRDACPSGVLPKVRRGTAQTPGSGLRSPQGVCKLAVTQ